MYTLTCRKPKTTHRSVGCRIVDIQLKLVGLAIVAVAMLSTKFSHVCLSGSFITSRVSYVLHASYKILYTYTQIALFFTFHKHYVLSVLDCDLYPYIDILKSDRIYPDHVKQWVCWTRDGKSKRVYVI